MNQSKSRQLKIWSIFLCVLLTSVISFTLVDTVFCSVMSTSAAQSNTFEKIFGNTNEDFISDARQTADGGYIIVGYTASFGAGDYDIWLIKTDSNGDACDFSVSGQCHDNNKGTFALTIGGEKADIPTAVIQASDGSYMIAGSTRSFSSSESAWLIKIDAMGNTCDYTSNGICESAGSFVKRFENPGDSVFYSIQQTTPDHGYVLSGRIMVNASDAPPQSAAWFVKLDATGNVLWDKTFGLQDESSAFYEVVQASDGFALFGTRAVSGSNLNVWLIKTDLNANICDYSAANGNCYSGNTFAVTYGEPNVDYQVKNGLLTSENGFIFFGNEMRNQKNQIFLLRMDSTGSVVWKTNFNGTAGSSNGFSSRGIQESSDGGFFMTGSIDTATFTTDQSLWLIKTNSNGQTCDYHVNGTCEDPNSNLFSRLFSGVEGNSISPTSDAGYLVSGASYSESTKHDFLLIKIDNENPPSVNSFLLKADSPQEETLWTNLPTVRIEMNETAPAGHQITKWLITESDSKPRPEDFTLTAKPLYYSFQDSSIYGFRTCYAWVLSDNNVVSNATSSSQQQIFYGLSGDANIDWQVNGLDIIKVQRYDVGLDSLQGTAFEMADTDANGIVNMVDAVNLLRYLHGHLTSIPTALPSYVQSIADGSGSSAPQS